MLKNYLKIALRNLLKRRGYTLINVMGLAVGIACCWLILVFVQDELRYDRFHEKADRIYRVTVHGHMAENDVTAANSPAPMAATLAAEYPEVVVAARIKQPDNTVLVSHGESKFNEQKVYFADSTFFEVFTFPLVMGDPKAALRKPFSIVVTEDVARKYFDRENPLGKVLVLNNDESYKVTGVVRNLPYQTHFRFDFLASFNSWDISRSTAWTSNHLYTYLVLQENYPAERLAAKFPSLVRKYLGPQMEEGMGVTYDQFVASGGIIEYSRQPLTEIHLHSHLAGELGPNSDVNYVTIFSLIAFFILLLACINFMNLATARSANRAKEVGLRKVVGSSRLQLVRQFLLESLIVSSVALLLAIGLIELFLPAFNDLAGKQMESAFVGGWTVWPLLFGAALGVGLLAGSYPAFCHRLVDVCAGGGVGALHRAADSEHASGESGAGESSEFSALRISRIRCDKFCFGQRERYRRARISPAKSGGCRCAPERIGIILFERGHAGHVFVFIDAGCRQRGAPNAARGGECGKYFSCHQYLLLADMKVKILLYKSKCRLRLNAYTSIDGELACGYT
ncbi:ABC transporter permease [candidate division KSB1 bacterium]|nr:ABC transporter permease [candidate division KSB1 bacterium]